MGITIDNVVVCMYYTTTYIKIAKMYLHIHLYLYTVYANNSYPYMQHVMCFLPPGKKLKVLSTHQRPDSKRQLQ